MRWFGTGGGEHWDAPPTKFYVGGQCPTKSYNKQVLHNSGVRDRPINEEAKWPSQL